jgi:hypothetical protein
MEIIFKIHRFGQGERRSVTSGPSLMSEIDREPKLFHVLLVLNLICFMASAVVEALQATSRFLRNPGRGICPNDHR